MPIYMVTRCPRGEEDQLGLWQCTWTALSAQLRLPQSGLAGSGFHLKRFSSRGDAAAYWVAEGWKPPAPGNDALEASWVASCRP